MSARTAKVRAQIAGVWRYLWWGVLHSQRSHEIHLIDLELMRAARRFTPEELDQLMVEQRPRWRRNDRAGAR